MSHWRCWWYALYKRCKQMKLQQVPSGTCVPASARRSIFDRRDLTSDSCLCTADSADVGSYTGRALKQIVVGCDGKNVVAQCPKGFYYLCSQGKARGGCRAKAKGPFPPADCQKQCHTT